MNRRGFLKRLAAFVPAAMITPAVIERVLTAEAEGGACAGVLDGDIFTVIKGGPVTVSLPAGIAGRCITVFNMAEAPVKVGDSTLSGFDVATWMHTGTRWAALMHCRPETVIWSRVAWTDAADEPVIREGRHG